MIDVRALGAHEAHQLDDAQLLLRTIQANLHDIVALANLPTVNSTDRDAAEEVVAIQGGHLQLQRLIDREFARRNVLQDQVHERRERLAFLLFRHDDRIVVGDVVVVMDGKTTAA